MCKSLEKISKMAKQQKSIPTRKTTRKLEKRWSRKRITKSTWPRNLLHVWMKMLALTNHLKVKVKVNWGRPEFILTKKTLDVNLHTKIVLADLVCSGSKQCKYFWALIDSFATCTLMVHAILNYKSHTKKDDLKSWTTENRKWFSDGRISKKILGKMRSHVSPKSWMKFRRIILFLKGIFNHCRNAKTQWKLFVWKRDQSQHWSQKSHKSIHLLSINSCFARLQSKANLSRRRKEH